MAFAEFTNPTAGGSIFDQQPKDKKQGSIFDAPSTTGTSIFDQQPQPPSQVGGFETGRRAATGTPPEQLARRADLARRSGFSESTIEGAEEEAQLAIERDAFIAAEREGLKATVTTLGNPANSQLAGNAVEQMSAVERRFRGMQEALDSGEGVGGAIGDAAKGLEAFGRTIGSQVDVTVGGIMQQVGEDFGQSPLGQLATIYGTGLRAIPDAVDGGERVEEFAGGIAGTRQSLTEEGQALYLPALEDLGAARDALGPAGKLAFDVAGGISDLVVGFGASVLTGSPVTGAAYMALRANSAAYAEGRANGMSHADASNRAIAFAIFEFLPEYGVLGSMMKKGGQFLPKVLQTASLEGAQEAITQALQIGYDTGVLNEEMTWGEAVEQILYSGLVGFTVGGGVQTGVSTFDAMIEGNADVMADGRHKKMLRLQTDLSGTDLRSLDLNVKTEFIANLIEDNKDIDAIYIPAEVLAEHFRTTPGRSAFYDALGMNVGDLADLVVAGDDVKLDGRAFARLVLLDETMADVMEHVQYGSRAVSVAQAQAAATSPEAEAEITQAEVEAAALTPEQEGAEEASAGATAFPFDDEFLEWFEGSAVTDESGQPLRLFRGIVSDPREDVPEGALLGEARPGYQTTLTTNPHMASTYAGDSATGYGDPTTGTLAPLYVKAAKIIEFPVHREEWRDGRFDIFAFDERAARLGPGEVLVARNAVDTGPRGTMADREAGVRGDVYAVGRGTEMRSAVTGARRARSPAEIEMAERMLGLQALFNNAKEAGLTDSEYTAYLAKLERRSDAAARRLQEKALRDQKRELTEEWEAERVRVREELLADFRTDPMHRAIDAIGQGQLDRKAVEGLVDPEVFDALPKTASRKPMVTAKSAKEGAGYSPHVIAELAGYESAEAMLTDLVQNYVPLEVAVERAAESEMRRRHGHIIGQKQAVEGALIELQHDDSLEIVEAELRMLQNSVPTKTLKNGKVVKAPDTKMVKEAARERISRMRVSDVNHRKLLVLAKRKGQEARRHLKGSYDKTTKTSIPPNREAAARAKFQQLVALAMAMEATKVRDTIAARRKYMRRFLREGQRFPLMEAGYLDRIRAVLKKFNLGSKMAEETADELMDKLKKWAEKNGTILSTPKRVLNMQKRNWQDLTVAEFDAVHSLVKELNQQGMRAKQFRLLRELVEMRQVAGELVAVAAANEGYIKTKRRQASLVESQQNHGWNKLVGQLASVEASFRKIENLLQELDGGVVGGLWSKYIFEPMSRSQARQADMVKQFLHPLFRDLEKLPGNPLKNINEETFIPELGRRMSKGNLLMLALNSGNVSNMNKVILGSQNDLPGTTPWTEESISAALDAHLTPEEGAWVQKAWDAFEEIRPQVEAVFEQEFGSKPEKIEPIEASIGGVKHKGGYFPLIYDHSRSSAKAKRARTAVMAVQRSETQGAVFSGMTKERTDFRDPVQLDLTKLAPKLQEHLYYVTHYEAIRDVQRLLGQDEIHNLLRDKLGQEYFDSLTAWVDALIEGGASEADDGARALQPVVEAARKNTTIAIMGFSYTTLASQVLGLATSVAVLGQRQGGRFSAWRGISSLARGLRFYLRGFSGGNPVEGWAQAAATKEAVFAMSGEMRHRMDNTQRELTEVLTALGTKKSSLGRFKRNTQEFSMRMIGSVQFWSVDMPTWLGAFDTALRDGATNDDAVRYADAVIRTSQGSGALKDLPALQRSRGFARWLTMFSTYLFVLYNLEVNNAQNATKGARQAGEAVSRFLWLATIPALGDALLRMEYDDDELEDDPLMWMFLKNISYSVGATPIVGRMVEEGIMGGRRAPGLSAVMAIPEAVFNALYELPKILDGSADGWRAAEKLLLAAGFAIGAPGTIQMARLLDAMHAGRKAEPYDFLIGHPDDNE